jgi:hypothetical protein
MYCYVFKWCVLQYSTLVIVHSTCIRQIFTCQYTPAHIIKCTSTHQYVPVHHSMYLYITVHTDIYLSVNISVHAAVDTGCTCTSMYLYLLVHTQMHLTICISNFQILWCFTLHACLYIVHALDKCDIYQYMQYIQVHYSTYQYWILVCTNWAISCWQLNPYNPTQVQHEPEIRLSHGLHRHSSCGW